MGELPEVQIVDDLVHHVAHILDKRHVAVHIAGGAEAVEHLQAEPVRRLDRGRVEVSDRLGQPEAPLLLLGARHCGEEPQDVIILGRAFAGEDIDQAFEGVHQTVAHSLAELSGGHSSERDDKKALDRQALFGHIASG